jgi:hypothetical protein
VMGSGVSSSGANWGQLDFWKAATTMSKHDEAQSDGLGYLA